MQQPPRYIKSRNYRNLDVDMIEEAITKDMWREIVGFDNVDECVKCLHSGWYYGFTDSY